MARPTLVSGLDLGQVADFSALACLERGPAENPTPKRRWSYSLRWLETWELGTRYTAICAAVAGRFESEALRWSPLAVDYTGVGVAVVEQLRGARPKARLHPVLITSGHQVQKIDPAAGRREHHVPKKELVSTLMTLLQAGLVRWDAKRLPLAARFERELAEFRVKVTKARNETFGADASQHDDLVLAVMLACWLGENTGGGDPSGIGLPAPGEGSAVEAAPAGVFVVPPDYHKGGTDGRDAAVRG